MIEKAIILAGGKGTRLYPVTLETPKPLLTINKKPIINYLIELFGLHGVEEVRVVIRPQDREDFEWWLRRWENAFGGINVALAEEAEPMGTIGYWTHALQNWTGQEQFFLTNGDELKEINLKEMAESHEKSGGLATIALVKVARPQEYGVAVLANDSDRIIDFLEKPPVPPSDLVSSGLYILDPKVADYLKHHVKNGQKFLMAEKDLFPQLAQDKKLFAYKSQGKWFDCGNLERWEKAIKVWES